MKAVGDCFGKSQMFVVNSIHSNFFHSNSFSRIVVYFFISMCLMSETHKTLYLSSWIFILIKLFDNYLMTYYNEQVKLIIKIIHFRGKYVVQ